MYRHLIRIEQRQSLAIYFNRLPIIRNLSTGKESDDSKPENASTEKKTKEKKVRSASKSVVIKVKSEATPKDAQSKMDSLMKSAKSIDSIGPNDKQTLSRNIGKPKTFIRQSARSQPAPVKAFPEEMEPVDKVAQGLDKRLVDAARRVAGKMPKHIAKATEKELIDSIDRTNKETLRAKKQFETSRPKEDYTKSISYQIMKENRQKATVNEATLAELNERIAPTVEKIKVTPRGVRSQRNFPTGFRKDTSLFSGECLNIFDPKGLYLNSDISRNLFWEKLLRDEIEQSVDFPPENPFEEMIKWTAEGRLWHYPINNEQGLDAEAEVPFYDHVLLDNLLDGFPEKGPIRQFMELVIMGLSHNPYITVERKHELVKFYKDFFEERNMLNLEITEEANNESTL
ncbi:PREDICTED: 28S ribosomal protein S31, mitochondrial [Rhagoletis zephyria]|uniref:28S ribosomal protein S31, mitochondrial n=1 Tax=Rhagoletis zephyria TaxID=28612 RepID=UPI000811527A|nr:PREDICTED: 28S ribosomal protein S31, mitochondrial [Rhagoletis zephyria]